MAQADSPSETQNGGLPPLRWGVLGAARIARKVLPALRESGAQLVAIGASSAERAEAFAHELEIPHAHGDYAAVLQRDDVDAVYIPLSNGLHFRWALECARAGKHCLVEKPLALTAAEARELHVAFRNSGHRLMEGFMWRHTPQTTWLLRRLEAGDIGELRRINATFSFNLERAHDYRWRDDQGGGALWDIGCYCMNAARLFFGVEPQRVSARTVPVQPGSVADRSVAGWADFGGDRLLTFSCSMSSCYAQELTLFGSHGMLRVVQPFSGGGRIEVTLHPAERSYERVFDPVSPFACMGQHFTRAAYDPSFALLPGEDGLAQARAMEALAHSGLNQGQMQFVRE
jgi:predicted dehydrogenase